MPFPHRIVYLVEDNPVYAEMICNHFEHKHPSFAVRRFATGEEMMPHLSLPPNWVILDYFLDGKNECAASGGMILNSIKALNSAINVIMITSSENLSIVANSLNDGAYAFVLKDEDLLYNLDEMIYG